MKQIQFWADGWGGRLVVVDVLTREKIEINQKRQIDQFLFIYGMQFEEIEGVVEAQDHFALFQ